ncbi:MAG: SGNH/GDSL hydrolase family protein [Francisellaceae bacterium]
MERITRVVVFGDSLQDNGNLIKTLKIPGEPFYQGRFSNGKVAIEYFTEALSMRQGDDIALLNYAIGGAMSSGKNPKSILTADAFSVSQQIDRFVASQGRFRQEEMVILNGGGNNMLFAIHDEKPYINISAIWRVAEDLICSIDRLIRLGAREIIVWNVPDVTEAPAFEVSVLPRFIVGWLKHYLKHGIKKQNGRLAKGIDMLTAKYPFVRLRLFDTYGFLHQVIENPLAYGFDDISGVCVESFGGVDAKGVIQTDIPIINDPVTHLFWDYVHPTTKAHKLLADEMLKLYDPLNSIE